MCGETIFDVPASLATWLAESIPGLLKKTFINTGSDLAEQYYILAKRLTES